MTFDITKYGIIAVLLTGAAAVSSGQVNTGAINTRDVDEQARNAYQRSCGLRAIDTQYSCRLGPLPAGQRLAIRWFSAQCSGPGASRVRAFNLIFPMGDITDQGFWSLRGPMQPLGSTVSDIRFLEAPLYAHSDEAPIIQIYLSEPSGFQPADCMLQVKGYTVQK